MWAAAALLLLGLLLLLLRNHPLRHRLELRLAELQAHPRHATATRAHTPPRQPAPPTPRRQLHPAATRTPSPGGKDHYRGLRVDTQDLDGTRTTPCIPAVQGAGSTLRERERDCMAPPPPAPRAGRGRRALQEGQSPVTPHINLWYGALEGELRRLQYLQKLTDETRVNSINALAAMEGEMSQIKGTVAAHPEYFTGVDDYREALMRQTRDQLATTITLQMQQHDIINRMATSPRQPCAFRNPLDTPLSLPKATSAATTPRGSACTTPSEGDLMPPTPVGLETPKGFMSLPPKRVPSKGGTPRSGKARRWKKGGVIGSGGFGTVYIAMDEGDRGKMMAVKNIPFGVNESADQRCSKLSSLKNEIDLMRALDHPNIVRYIGAERDGSSLNIFMEYVSGGSIASLLKMFGPLTECVVVAYTFQVLNGLQYLHSRGVIHRDIKGANILLTVNGVCKLSDFGAATYIHSPALHTSFVGTPLWMPPEVIRQDGHTYSADIWSLGCTVMEMLTADPPWNHVCQTPMSALNYITGEADIEQDIRRVLSGLACEAGVEFVLSCVVRDPKLRMGTDALMRHVWMMSVEEDVVDAEEDANIWKTAVHENNAKLYRTLGHAEVVVPPATPLSIAPAVAAPLRVPIQRAPGFRKSSSPENPTPSRPTAIDMPAEGTPAPAPILPQDDVTLSPMSPPPYVMSPGSPSTGTVCIDSAALFRKQAMGAFG